MPYQAIRNLLGRYDMELTDASLQALAGIMQHKVYQKEEQVLEMDQRCSAMYLVESGVLRQYYYKGGRNITEHFCCDGDLCFCIESLFKHKPTELAIEAIVPTSVWMIDYATLKRLSDVHTDINHLLQSILEQDLVLSQYKADSWRFETSHERYERFCREYPQAARVASIAHIASYLLMAPETLSRVRTGLL